ncbi:MAG: hypothetical protein HQL75_12040, partial [Magnetococcales bacterium]|nr:hypothetical protein [Magnetococcales bacterium]
MANATRMARLCGYRQFGCGIHRAAVKGFPPGWHRCDGLGANRLVFLAEIAKLTEDKWYGSTQEREGNRLGSSTTRTCWHCLVGATLKELLEPVGIEVRTEVPVLSQPPKADIILLQRKGG